MSTATTLVDRIRRYYYWRFQMDRILAVGMHLACASYFLLAAVFGESTLGRIGSGLLAIGLVISAVRFMKIGAMAQLPKSAPERLSVLRNQLEDRRQAAQAYSRDIILPTIPGTFVGLVGWVASSPRGFWLVASIAALFVAVQYFAWLQQAGIVTELDREVALLQSAQCS